MKRVGGALNSDTEAVNERRTLAEEVAERGFAAVSRCLDETALEELGGQIGVSSHAERNLLQIPVVRKIAGSDAVRRHITAILGPECFAVRGILFNKTPNSNWKVVWHQDRTIAVREQRDVFGFGPWSTKARVLHVQPPASVMAKMVAIRLHLDESTEDNGPLRVIPGSHRAGCFSAEQIDAWRERPSVTCVVARGGAILMRPLLLHASSACAKPAPRRVVHLEFAAEGLPGGLEWYERV